MQTTSASARNSRFVPRWYLVLLALVVLVNVVVRLPLAWLPPVMHDVAIRNVATGVGVLVLAVAWTVWFAVAGSVTRWRWVPLGALVGLLGIAAASVRIDQVWGGLFPYRISWRWSPKHDERLAKLQPPLPDAQTIADLETTTPDDYPEFLGKMGTASVLDRQLDPDWDAHPPELVWRQPIGAGWSAFAAVNGYAVTMEQRGDDELVTCYEIATGNVCWATAEKTRHETILGGVGPRATPTVVGGRVYALGATGILRALDGRDGRVIWRQDLRANYGISDEEDERQIAWGRAHSPLVVDGLVIVPVGGPVGGPHVTLLALNAETGETVWEGGSRLPSYASPSLATIADMRQVILVVEGHVVGHSLETGEELWSFPWPSHSNSDAATSQAVLLENNRIFVSKGYGLGAAVFQVEKGNDGSWSCEQQWHNSRALKTKLTNVVIDAGYAYGLDEGILSCVDMENGRVRWKRGRYGHGQVMRIGQHLLVVGEQGEVALVELTPERFREVARFQAIEGKTWNNPCFSAPYLLVRNSEEAACYRLALLLGPNAPQGAER